MDAGIRLELLPLGRVLDVAPGAPLRDVLFPQGVEFPCGGNGRCRGCRIRVVKGDLAVTPDDARAFAEREIEAGWRLACRARATGNLTIELAQWEAAILSDQSAFVFAPRDGLGVAVDLGTTTLVAQLLDLSTGDVRAVRTALNAQARHGADVMSRIEFAVHGGGAAELTAMIRTQVGGLIEELRAEVGDATQPLRDVVLVGNTAMHHLFCGLGTEPLARAPFEPVEDGGRQFTAAALGWPLPGDPAVRFLPCLGGFVGSDLLAGVLATRLHEADTLTALVDLGTNGEMVVGHRGRMLCASTAAGPAFEGARISRGMRAVTGAISEVSVEHGALRCRVLGNAPARGLCGSGLVDAVAAGLDLGWIQSSGRLTSGAALSLAPGVDLTQADIRELQLAKGAIAAGLRLVLAQWGAGVGDVTRLHLAGAFGNYIDRESARRIGLLPFAPDTVAPAGNTALLGAKIALFHPDESFEALRRHIQHVPLSEEAEFQETFVEEMSFPEKVAAP
jgi:uncharacterized 2Fe-2S/4Fe-4S cluster protein (DUF4445 family)